MSRCFRMDYNSRTNKYSISMMGSTNLVDHSKLDGVLKVTSTAWVSKNKNDLIEYANNNIAERIEKHKKAIENLIEREIIL